MSERMEKQRVVRHHEKQVAVTRGEQRGQSSVDTWEQAKSKGEWMEASADYEALEKEKKNHVVQEKHGKCKNRSLHRTLEKTVTDEKKEARDRKSLATNWKFSSKRK